MRKERIGSAAAVVMALIFGFTAVGCLHVHSVPVRNETGVVITEVFVRNTGTANWGDPVTFARRDNGLHVIRHTNAAGQQVISHWDRVTIGNAAEGDVIRQEHVGSTPREMPNQDILVRDTNGIFYMKTNVPVTFTTLRANIFQSAWLENHTVMTTAEPIVFTVEDRLPMLFVQNQTGHAVSLAIPVTAAIPPGSDFGFQPTDIGNISVVYTVGQIQFTEQVHIDGEDATLTLTRGPGRLLLQNQTGHPITLTAPSSQPVPPGELLYSRPTEASILLTPAARLHLPSRQLPWATMKMLP